VRRPDELARLVGEVVEDAAADGAVWAEVSVWPGFLRGRLGPDELVIERLVDAGTLASQEHGVGFGLMVAANRNRGPEEAVRVAELAATFAGRGVVSFGLDGDEAAYPAAFYARPSRSPRAQGCYVRRTLVNCVVLTLSSRHWIIFTQTAFFTGSVRGRTQT